MAERHQRYDYHGYLCNQRMTCPCHNCLVYIRCQHRVERHLFRNKQVYYSFDQLVQECDELKKFFGLDTLQHRVRLKNHERMSSRYDRTIMSYIEEQPHGKKLMEEFLKVMHIKEMPNSINPKVRLKGP